MKSSFINNHKTRLYTCCRVSFSFSSDVTHLKHTLVPHVATVFVNAEVVLRWRIVVLLETTTRSRCLCQEFKKQLDEQQGSFNEFIFHCFLLEKQNFHSFKIKHWTDQVTEQVEQQHFTLTLHDGSSLLTRPTLTVWGISHFKTNACFYKVIVSKSHRKFEGNYL